MTFFIEFIKDLEIEGQNKILPLFTGEKIFILKTEIKQN